MSCGPCALAIIALAGCGSAAAAQRSWQRPVNLSAPSAEGDLPIVAMNPAGDTVVRLSLNLSEKLGRSDGGVRRDR